MSWKHLFAKKDLEMLLAEMAGEHRLHRVLGPVALTSLGVGCIIGAGIFVRDRRGGGRRRRARPSWFRSPSPPSAARLAALCYAEFAAMAPVAGSAYTYAYTTLGEIFAWIIGWDLILEYAMGCATVASSWTKYSTSCSTAIGTLCEFPIWLLVRSVYPWKACRANRGSICPSLFIMLLRHHGPGDWDSRERADQRHAGDDQAERGVVGHRAWAGPTSIRRTGPRFPWPSGCFRRNAVIAATRQGTLRQDGRLRTRGGA